MSAEDFIDTNVFVYQLDASDARKHKVADRIVRDSLQGGGCISFQVVQECLNTVLRKAKLGLDASSARMYLDTVLLPLLQVSPSVGLYHRALEIQSRWRFAFYDSLIVAAALSTGCKRLLTEDLQHGQRIDGLTIHNPFVR